jgi:signal transduction histidine kinase
MSLKVRSLSFKLVLLYVASMLIIMALVIAYIEYNHSQETSRAANITMEVGPGYINGQTPWEFESEITQNGESLADILAVMNGLTAEKVIASASDGMDAGDNYQGFKLVADTYNVSSLIPPAGNTITIQELTAPTEPRYYNTYSLTMSQSEIGAILLTDNYFATTVNDYIHNESWHRFYYMPLNGYDDVVIIASLDIRFLPDHGWAKTLASDLLEAAPIILICALIMGWIISKTAASPIKQIAEATEEISERDLSKRVAVKSQDEIGSLARSFNNMADRLEKAFQAQKRFVSDAAHEIRTPLASMKTSISLALSKPRQKEDDERLLIRLSSRVETMEKLTNELLEQARADEQPGASESKPVDVAAVISKAAEAFTPLFQDDNISFDVHTENNLTIKGDAGALLRVISNLLDNAAKNTPAGKSVSLEAFKQDNDIIVKVRDTGRGIAPEHIGNIFERFYRGTDGQTDNGFGLGLSICRSIIHRFGGEIIVESRLGEGSTFTVTLPAYQAKTSSHT